VIVVEPLNHFEHPRYPLTSSKSVVELVQQVRRLTGREIKLQFDVYHAAREGEDPVTSVLEFAPALGHVQLADVPGRGEPGTGGLDWPAVFGALDQVGYDGAIGLEYVPTANTRASLSWFRPHSDS
jgi:hydroxypyruvate isomerase